MELRTIMYTQMQPWSTMGASPVMEKVSAPPITPRVGELYKTPRPHPWRPTLGYETVQIAQLPSQAVTNQIMDPCYTPMGMSMCPLTFPNLVTGFERNPSHAARAVLYTRHTPAEWNQSHVRLENEVNASQRSADELRNSSMRIMRKADEMVKEGQAESSRMIGQRISDINFLARELTSELDKIVEENRKMQGSMRDLSRAIANVEAPLYITQECLYHREGRKGVELVHDEVEKALLHEVEAAHNARKQLKVFTDRCSDQLANGRAVQHELEMDIQNKNSVLGLDVMCHQMNNSSRGLEFYGGIEKYNNSIIDEKSWIEAGETIINKSKMIRARSQQLQVEINTAISDSVQKIWSAWTKTDNALAARISEMLQAKQQVLNLLRKVQNEIFAVERESILVKKAVTDKSANLKVAHTRLEARTHRPQAELCQDASQSNIVREVKVIKAMIDDFHTKLQQSEALHQQLLCTRATLEDDLKAKADALFIDRDSCMALRQSFPMSSIGKY